MTTPFPNTYHHRRVAPTSSKPCMICHKPSTSVLITPDNRDFFYICPGHLTDRGFATPVVDREEEERKRKKEELDKAVAEVKREWEERQKKSKEKAKKEKEKAKEKDKDKGKEGSSGGGGGEKETEDEKSEEKDKDDKIKKLESDAGAGARSEGADEGSRIYNLHKSVYQMRVNRLQTAQRAKRDAERTRNPISFPAVPSGFPLREA